MSAIEAEPLPDRITELFARIADERPDPQVTLGDFIVWWKAVAFAQSCALRADCDPPRPVPERPAIYRLLAHCPECNAVMEHVNGSTVRKVLNTESSAVVQCVPCRKRYLISARLTKAAP